MWAQQPGAWVELKENKDSGRRGTHQLVWLSMLGQVPSPPGAWVPEQRQDVTARPCTSPQGGRLPATPTSHGYASRTYHPLPSPPTPTAPRPVASTWSRAAQILFVVENCSSTLEAENVIKLLVPFKMNIQQHGDKISG